MRVEEDESGRAEDDESRGREEERRKRTRGMRNNGTQHLTGFSIFR